MNSVGNLVLHLTGNLRQRFLSDVGGEPFDRDRFGSSPNGGRSRDELVERFDDRRPGRCVCCRTVHQSTVGAVLPQYVVTAGTIDGTVQTLILRTLMHLAGHTQEIVFMTRLAVG